MFNKEKHLLKNLKKNIFDDEKEENPKDQKWKNHKK